MNKGASLNILIAASAIGLAAGCVSAPTVPPTVHAIEREPVVIVPGASDGAQAARAAVAAVAAEGSADLLKRHLSIMTNLNHALFAGNRIDLFVDGPPTFDAMFEDIEAARSSILVESYIFEDSAIGEHLGELLARKARAGVLVHVIYDSVGSITTSDGYFAALGDAGVQVCAFNPLNPLKIRRLQNPNTRDHRKIVVVDDRVGYTGGINVSQVYASSSLPGFRRKKPDLGWRDTQVRVEGPAAAQLGALVRKTLESQGCDAPPAPPQDAGAPPGGKLIGIVTSDGDDDGNPIYEALYAAIEGARRSVDLTMAYFSPDRRFIQALERAARRGVRVRLLLAGETDWPILRYAGQAHFSGLLRAGVEIHLYQDGTLHAKTAVVDGVWSTVGSFNLDWRSLVFNDEINAVVMGREFAGRMTEVFERDIGRARQVTWAAWRTRGLSERLREFSAHIMRRWL